MSRYCSTEGCERRAVAGTLCNHHNPEHTWTRFFPVGPLVALVEAKGGPAECGADRNERRAYNRAKSVGYLTELTADRLSFAMLNRHPWEVWSDWFSARDDAPDLAIMGGGPRANEGHLTTEQG